MIFFLMEKVSVFQAATSVELSPLLSRLIDSPLIPLFHIIRFPVMNQRHPFSETSPTAAD